MGRNTGTFSSETCFSLGRRFTFQQDNDLNHPAEATYEWFKEKRVNVPEWPSQSQTSIWLKISALTWRLLSRKREPSNLDELGCLCHEEWAKIPVERCGKRWLYKALMLGAWINKHIPIFIYLKIIDVYIISHFTLPTWITLCRSISQNIHMKNKL